MSRRALAVLLVSLLGSMAKVPSGGADLPRPLRAQDVHFFERKIRPILIERCYPCHDAARAEGTLRLDTAEGLRRGGAHGPVLWPDRPLGSPLLQMIRKAHPEDGPARRGPMPIGNVLDFEAWVKAGAPDPRSGVTPPLPRDSSSTRHWAFQPLASAPVPTVRDRGWVQDPIDAFIVARLEAQQLKPTAPADRISLIRRAAFDLTGLPPTPAEVQAFLTDSAPGAFTRVVDLFLESKRFGEHWGRLWLRDMEYADSASAGVNALYEYAWRYRDYVISAFNQDKPFDQFVREQLAGDLLTSTNSADAQEKLIATGFLVLGPKFVLDPNSRKLALDIADEQIEVVSRVFLGLTVSCARCHDHKSDPISVRDYYALAGIFTSTATVESGEARRRGAPHRLERSLASPEQLAEISEFEKRFAELRDQVRAARERQMEVPGDVDSTLLSGVVVDNLAAEVRGAWKESNYSTNFVDRNYLHDGNADKGKKSVRYVPKLPEAGLYDVLVSYTPRANRATNVPVSIRCQDGLKKVLLDQTRVPTVDKVFTSVGRFRFQAGTNGFVEISNEGTKGFVVADAVRFVPADAAQTGAAPPSVARTEPEAAFLNYHQLEKQLLEMQAKRPVLPKAMAVQDGKVQDCRLRAGGDPNAPGEPVPRGFPQAVGAPNSTLYAITDEDSGRLELAYWSASPENPLTARVAVNRIWQQLFGRGLVATPGDFGTLGARPDNPELLDHLAKRFIDLGWSVKKLIRAVMLSSAYGMNSTPEEPGKNVDPENRLLGRMTFHRVDAEVIRDAVLAVSGDLDPATGGPWADMTTMLREGVAAATRVQRTSLRRSVYLPVLPGAVPDVLRALEKSSFVAPLGFGGSVGPGNQLLSINPFLRRQARTWAWRIVVGSDDSATLKLAYQQALSRSPTPAETEHALTMLKAQAEANGAEAKLAAWQAILEEILASAEFQVVR